MARRLQPQFISTKPRQGALSFVRTVLQHSIPGLVDSKSAKLLGKNALAMVMK
jgi:hypothetical protein